MVSCCRIWVPVVTLEFACWVAEPNWVIIESYCCWIVVVPPGGGLSCSCAISNATLPSPGAFGVPLTATFVGSACNVVFTAMVPDERCR